MSKKKKKEIINIPIPKPRNSALINAQIKGLLRTRVIKNKKKEIKKFNWKKEIPYYSNVYLLSI